MQIGHIPPAKQLQRKSCERVSKQSGTYKRDLLSVWKVEVKQGCSQLGNSAYTPLSPLPSLQKLWSYETKETCKLESFYILKSKTNFSAKMIQLGISANTTQYKVSEQSRVSKHSAYSNLSPHRLLWKTQSRLLQIPPCKHTIYRSFIKYNLVFLFRSANLLQVANYLLLIFLFIQLLLFTFSFFQESLSPGAKALLERKFISLQFGWKITPAVTA